MKITNAIPIEACRKLTTAIDRAEGDRFIAIRCGQEVLYVTGDWHEGDRVEFLVAVGERMAQVVNTVAI